MLTPELVEELHRRWQQRVSRVPLRMSDIRVTPTVTIPENELQLKFSRSGGPGGQNVNTRDTKVEVIFDVTGSPSLGPRQRLRALQKPGRPHRRRRQAARVASEARTQARTVSWPSAAELADGRRPAPAPAPSRPTKPSKGAQERRLASKRPGAS